MTQVANGASPKAQSLFGLSDAGVCAKCKRGERLAPVSAGKRLAFVKFCDFLFRFRHVVCSAGHFSLALTTVAPRLLHRFKRDAHLVVEFGDGRLAIGLHACVLRKHLQARHALYALGARRIVGGSGARQIIVSFDKRGGLHAPIAHPGWRQRGKTAARPQGAPILIKHRTLLCAS